jgi:ankyrin repeat protein
VINGRLPIHITTVNSSLDVVNFPLNVHKETDTLIMVIADQGNGGGGTLLHQACENNYNIADAKAFVEYLCKLCPALVRNTPLHLAFRILGKLNVEVLKILCDIDESVMRDKCTPTAVTSPLSQQLPLYFLIQWKPPRTEVPNEGDCFRLLLQLHPASAGVKDGHLKTPYDFAVSKGLSVNFIRLLLNGDPTIDPVQRRNLNYAARREGMFLA